VRPVGLRKIAARTSYVFAGVLFALGIGFGADWANDNTVLRRKAEEIVVGLDKASDRIAALNHWVFENQGFAKNQKYFLLKQLGPTPIQVLEAGGDCADKSRLVSAMLAQLGIPSGLAMIMECKNCPPIHTVVEAVHESGRMVVDPIWDVDYTDSSGRHLGIADLSGSKLGWERVTELKRARGMSSKIILMSPSEATFDYAVPVNWNKNSFTKAVAALLRVFQVEPYSILRPRFLEDPKLFLAAGSFALALAGLFGGTVLTFLPKRRRRGKNAALLSNS
jgi:hypothetical protein